VESAAEDWAIATGAARVAARRQATFKSSMESPTGNAYRLAKAQGIWRVTGAANAAALFEVESVSWDIRYPPPS
jgi:hypothetical protein